MIARRALPLVVMAALGLGASPPSAGAADGQYQVIKCHVFSWSASEVEAGAAGPYQTADSCASNDHRLEVTVDGYGLPGQSGYLRFTAPDSTSIVGATVDANLRRDNRHFAQLAVVDYQGNSRVLANGSDAGTGFQTYSFTGLNDLRFVMQLFCSDPGGCPNSPQAHAYARNVLLVLADRADPGITEIGGSLLDGGWLRGSRAIQLGAGDLGSGLSAVWLEINGSEIARTLGACPGVLSSVSSLLAPCHGLPTRSQLGARTNTGEAPFIDGVNHVSSCAQDFAGNGPVCRTDVIRVDNLAPVASFADGQDAADPELIRVRAVDTHSGIDPATGEIAYRAVAGGDWTPLVTRFDEGFLSARVDSNTVAPGRYEFTAAVGDLAGNTAQTSVRADGEPMVLTFPLREPVQLVARVGSGGARQQTIAYGRESKAHGRLLDDTGAPMVGQEVTVSEYFGAGALIDRRVRTVTTDGRGRWSSLLPAGPSRTVDVAFPGTLRFQPSAASSRQLHVRSRSSFETSADRVREGRSVEFSGKVGHFGARVPSGGKLVELQVREGAGRWNTVREALYTDSSGRFRLRYRFGQFYETNAEFIFRVKIAREQGWPYKAPGRSRSRAVTVVANR